MRLSDGEARQVLESALRAMVTQMQSGSAEDRQAALAKAARAIDMVTHGMPANEPPREPIGALAAADTAARYANDLERLAKDLAQALSDIDAGFAKPLRPHIDKLLERARAAKLLP